MKVQWKLILGGMLSALGACSSSVIHGDDVHAHPVPAVTEPNGSSPAKVNAPRASMNDTDAMRSEWNHGNGVLWVYLRPASVVTPDGEQEEYLRVKFGWWRMPGVFSIEGRRLDKPGPPMKALFDAGAAGSFGLTPSYLLFPEHGYWEITGKVDDKELVIVVHVAGGVE